MRIFDFTPKQRSQVVLEIGEQYVKAVYSQASIKENASLRHMLVYKEGLTGEEITESIRNFIQTHSIAKDTQFVCIVPSCYAIYRNVEIPSVDKKEIDQIVDLQAGSHTPYPKNEIVIDYCRAGVVYERYSKIMLVIVKRDIILKRYELIKKAGCDIDEVCLAPEVEAKFLSEVLSSKENSPLGVLHIDIMFSDFIIIQGGLCLYVRSIPYGALSLKTDSEDSKKLLADEIKKTLESYQANSVAAMPSSIYVAAEKILSESVVEALRGISGTDIKPFDYTSLPENFGKVLGNTDTGFSTTFLPAVSAVFTKDKNKMSFIPADIRMQNHIKKSSQDAMRLGLFSIILFVLFCAVILTNIALKDLYYKRICSEYAEEEQQVKKLEDITMRIRVIKEFLISKGASLNVLSELYSSMPEEVYLSSIKYMREGTLSFTGTANSMSRIFSLVTELENSVSFKDVKVDFTRSRRQAGQEVSDFGLTLIFVR
jgi:Tfp pilus assembly PilM family ATPase